MTIIAREETDIAQLFSNFIQPCAISVAICSARARGGPDSENRSHMLQATGVNKSLGTRKFVDQNSFKLSIYQKHGLTRPTTRLLG